MVEDAQLLVGLDFSTTTIEPGDIITQYTADGGTTASGHVVERVRLANNEFSNDLYVRSNQLFLAGLTVIKEDTVVAVTVTGSRQRTSLGPPEHVLRQTVLSEPTYQTISRRGAGMVPAPLVDPVDPSSDKPHIRGSATPDHTIYVFEDVPSGDLNDGDEWYGDEWYEEPDPKNIHEVGDGTPVPDHVRVLVGSSTANAQARWSVAYDRRNLDPGELVHAIAVGRRGAVLSRARRFFWSRDVDDLQLQAVPTRTYFGDIHVVES